MVAVVRGERSPARPRSKSAPAARSAPTGRARAAGQTSAKPARSDHAGLGPGAALAVAAAVLAAGAVGALVLSHRGETHAAAPAFGLGRALAPWGFTVKHVDLQGAPDAARADILRAANLTQGQPIVGLDLDALRTRVEGAGWVKSAKIIRLLPDTLVIAVVPRQPQAVWQHLGVARVVDAEGKVIGDADPGRFPDLPLVVGDGAAQEAGAILPLLRGRPKLMALVDALIRVDGRRWDLRLKDGAIVQLPAVGEDSALIQLDQLDRKARVLDLGFERIDLRDPDVVAVRPKASLSPASGPQQPRD